MKFWQNITWVETEQLTDVARFAESVGYHGVMNAEHLFLCRTTESSYPYTHDGKMNHHLQYDHSDVWTSFAAMAAVTSTLEFSSCVYLLPLRNPIDVAKQASTVARLSGNRVSIGFGVGWQKEEFDAMGVEFKTRGKRTDEMIEVMGRLWAGGEVTHNGRFFSFRDVELRPLPTEPVPMYCGGTSEAAMRRAAFLCDGFVGAGRPLAEIPKLVKDLQALRRDSPRADIPFEIIEHVRPKDPNQSLDDYQRMRDAGVTGTVLPPFDVGATNRGKVQGLGQFSALDEKKRVMEQYAERVLTKM